MTTLRLNRPIKRSRVTPIEVFATKRQWLINRENRTQRIRAAAAHARSVTRDGTPISFR